MLFIALILNESDGIFMLGVIFIQTNFNFFLTNEPLLSKILMPSERVMTWAQIQKKIVIHVAMFRKKIEFWNLPI